MESFSVAELMVQSSSLRIFDANFSHWTLLSLGESNRERNTFTLEKGSRFHQIFALSLLPPKKLQQLIQDKGIGLNLSLNFEIVIGISC
jgi:hypothetical protein